MADNNYLFTSESVSEGHPDKVCDRISDMVVDSYLTRDPVSRVACETLTTTNKVVLAGETRGPKIDKDELIQKLETVFKILAMIKLDLVGKLLTLKLFYMNNLLILRWESTQKIIRTKVLVIRA